MILEKLKVLDIRKVGDTDSGLEADIDKSSLPFVFEIVSKQLYSNPIGSIIREIVSNCFDSHIEAGVNQPVIVSKTYSTEEGFAIEFKDSGIGMSPDRIDTVYNKWFSSTKRDSNDQIGAFGLGSKTPLAYDGCGGMFYITTIYDRLKYEYIYHRGENKPTLESLLGYDEVEEEYSVNSEYNEESNEWIELEEPEIRTRIVKIPIGEPTDEHNGTTIKINIEDKDIHKFKSELKLQLAYFDDVYFSGWEISNDYDIYEGKYFKFRSDIDQSNTPIHLCIGKVRYPIDIIKLNIPRDVISIPIAVKFEIGELQVTPSRETLRYNDKDVKLIEERVALAVKEITDIFETQNPEIEDFETFDKLTRDTPKVTFNKEKGHGIYVWENSGISKNYKFKPFSNLPFKKTPKNFFFMWECIGYVDRGGFHAYSEYNGAIDNNFIIRNRDRVLTIRRDEKTSDYTNISITENYIGNIYIIRRKRLDFNSAIEYLGLNSISKKKFGQVDKKVREYTAEEVEKAKKESRGKGKINTISKAKILSEFIKIVDGLVADRSKFYSDFRPTQEWINEYKKSILESSAAFIRKKNQKVFIRDAAYSFSSREVKQIDLERRTGILVYGFREHQNILSSIYNTVIRSWETFRRMTTVTKQHKAFMVIQIAKDNEKLVIGGRETWYWENFLMSDFFIEVVTYYRMYRLFDSIPLAWSSLRSEFFKDYEEDLDKVQKLFSTKIRGSEFCIAEEYLKDIGTDESKFKEIHNFMFKYDIRLPVLPFTKGHGGSYETRALVNYLKYIGVRLKNQYYLKTDKQLAKEERHRKFISTTLELINSIYKPVQNNLLTFNQIQDANIKEDNQEGDSEESSQEDLSL